MMEKQIKKEDKKEKELTVYEPLKMKISGLAERHIVVCLAKSVHQNIFYLVTKVTGASGGDFERFYIGPPEKMKRLKCQVTKYHSDKHVILEYNIDNKKGKLSISFNRFSMDSRDEWDNHITKLRVFRGNF